MSTDERHTPLLNGQSLSGSELQAAPVADGDNRGDRWSEGGGQRGHVMRQQSIRVRENALEEVTSTLEVLQSGRYFLAFKLVLGIFRFLLFTSVLYLSSKEMDQTYLWVYLLIMDVCEVVSIFISLSSSDARRSQGGGAELHTSAREERGADSAAATAEGPAHVPLERGAGGRRAALSEEPFIADPLLPIFIMFVVLYCNWSMAFCTIMAPDSSEVLQDSPLLYWVSFVVIVFDATVVLGIVVFYLAMTYNTPVFLYTVGTVAEIGGTIDGASEAMISRLPSYRFQTRKDEETPPMSSSAMIPRSSSVPARTSSRDSSLSMRYQVVSRYHRSSSFPGTGAPSPSSFRAMSSTKYAFQALKAITIATSPFASTWEPPDAIMVPLGGERAPWHLRGEDAHCSICWSRYKDGEEIKVLPCIHHFHERCINKWLRIKATCPLCVDDIRNPRHIDQWHPQP